MFCSPNLWQRRQNVSRAHNKLIEKKEALVIALHCRLEYVYAGMNQPRACRVLSYRPKHDPLVKCRIPDRLCSSNLCNLSYSVCCLHTGTAKTCQHTVAMLMVMVFVQVHYTDL